MAQRVSEMGVYCKCSNVVKREICEAGRLRERENESGPVHPHEANYLQFTVDCTDVDDLTDHTGDLQ